MSPLGQKILSGATRGERSEAGRTLAWELILSFARHQIVSRMPEGEG